MSMRLDNGVAGGIQFSHCLNIHVIVSGDTNKININALHIMP